MRFSTVVLAGLISTWSYGADVQFEQRLDLKVDGKIWLSTMTTPLDATHREETYKVFTHIYDFEGVSPITKGAGGKFTHHRGMFIGWKDTMVQGRDFDTWHMPDNAQHHVAWQALESSPDHGRQIEEIDWRDDDGRTFIKELRTIAARADADGRRIFDFTSNLTSLAGTIQLKGDLQHAGMQVRLANEVSEHEDSTHYILPEGAEELDDDKVVGAWWVACSAVVNGQRYWLLHMTPPDHPTGQPVYSIRRYARFGAFFEPELTEASPLHLRFRVVLSRTELSREVCEALYKTYADEQP